MTCAVVDVRWICLQLTPVKICDFDLGSGVIVDSRHATPVTTPELQTPVSRTLHLIQQLCEVETPPRIL